MIAALVMEVTYGLSIESHDDKFLQATELGFEYSERALVPGAFLVDVFPICKYLSLYFVPALRRPKVTYLPEWFPGAGFKAFAKVGEKAMNRAVDGPLEHVKDCLKVSTLNTSSKVSLRMK